jgi:hypothetical protein
LGKSGVRELGNSPDIVASRKNFVHSRPVFQKLRWVIENLNRTTFKGSLGVALVVYRDETLKLFMQINDVVLLERTHEVGKARPQQRFIIGPERIGNDTNAHQISRDHLKVVRQSPPVIADEERIAAGRIPEIMAWNGSEEEPPPGAR